MDQFYQKMINIHFTFQVEAFFFRIHFLFSRATVSTTFTFALSLFGKKDLHFSVSLAIIWCSESCDTGSCRSSPRDQSAKLTTQLIWLPNHFHLAASVLVEKLFHMLEKDIADYKYYVNSTEAGGLKLSSHCGTVLNTAVLLLKLKILYAGSLWMQ